MANEKFDANGNPIVDDNEGKVKLKDKIKASVEREHTVTWSWGKVIRTVALVAAIPVAFVAGKSIQKNRDDELLDLAMGGNDDQPQLPVSEPIEIPVESEPTEPEYVEEYVEEE